MRALISGLVIALVVTLAGSASATEPGDDDWHGSADVRPYVYGWLGDYTPDYDYEIITIRGLSVKQVLKTLGTVRRQMRDMSPRRSEAWVLNHSDRYYSSPAIALVDKRGPAVVVYLPYWIQENRTIARLSRKGLAAHFTTTIELDTYVTIAKDGRVVRQFDAGFEPPRHHALPEEEGLDWGMPDQNIWATAWAFAERVSLIHISKEWFNSKHPTYRFADTGP